MLLADNEIGVKAASYAKINEQADVVTLSKSLNRVQIHIESV